jgi:hypothetical protein
VPTRFQIGNVRQRASSEGAPAFRVLCGDLGQFGDHQDENPCLVSPKGTLVSKIIKKGWAGGRAVSTGKGTEIVVKSVILFDDEDDVLHSGYVLP